MTKYNINITSENKKFYATMKTEYFFITGFIGVNMQEIKSNLEKWLKQSPNKKIKNITINSYPKKVFLGYQEKIPSFQVKELKNHFKFFN